MRVTDVSETRLLNGATLIAFAAGSDSDRVFARAQNFLVEWMQGKGKSLSFESHDEVILMLPAGDAVVTGETESATLEGPTLAIVPPGPHRVTLGGTEPLVVLATSRPDLVGLQSLNDPTAADDRVAPVGEAFVREQPNAAIKILPVQAIPTPPNNPRIRFVQSATMSINFVLYEGPRGASALSPHAHTDIEQGTLALNGTYIHHLRTPWGPDATMWRDDVHLEAAPGSLLLIPPHLIHTTEGVGEERHLLVDIFAPPRRDFIAKGWVANAADYVDPQQRL